MKTEDKTTAELFLDMWAELGDLQAASERVLSTDFARGKARLADETDKEALEGLRKALEGK